MTWSYTRKVKYYETDRMGVVHHSNYLRLLEDARTEWMDAEFMPYSDMEKMGIIIPFVESHGKFKHFLRFGDSFTVYVKIALYNAIRINFEYKIYNPETGDLCYEGTTNHYFASDTEDYRPISLKRKFPELHEKLQKIYDEQTEGEAGSRS